MLLFFDSIDIALLTAEIAALIPEGKGRRDDRLWNSPASYSVGTGALSHGGKASGA
jgi:hypothetical protein